MMRNVFTGFLVSIVSFIFGAVAVVAAFLKLVTKLEATEEFRSLSGAMIGNALFGPRDSSYRYHDHSYDYRYRKGRMRYEYTNDDEKEDAI